ncbi:MAG: hypothetical protein C0504_13900 [Candidatus Solibacter sp.]|nr:hypothetical protein [Candidatus Solibacter sp.]
MRSAAGRFDTANAIKLSKLKRLIYEDPATKPFREFPPGTVVVSEKDAVFHNFLRAEMSKSTVSLDNLGWYGRCGLGNLGIQVPGAGQ